MTNVLSTHNPHMHSQIKRRYKIKRYIKQKLKRASELSLLPFDNVEVPEIKNDGPEIKVEVLENHFAFDVYQ